MPKPSRLAAAFVATLSLVVGAVAGCSNFSEEDGPTTDGPDADGGAAESSLPEGEIPETEPPPGPDDGGSDSGLDCTDPSILLCDGFERSTALAPPWTSQVTLGGGMLRTSDNPLFHGKSLSVMLGASAGIESSAALLFTLNSAGRNPTLRARFSFYIPVKTTTTPKAPLTLAKVVLGDPPADGGTTRGNIAVIYDPVTGPSLYLVDNLNMKGQRQLVTMGAWYDAVFSVSGAVQLMSPATLVVTPHGGATPTTGVLMSAQTTVNGPRAVTLGISIDGTDPHFGGQLSIDDVIISSY